MKTFRLTVPFNAVILFQAETEADAEKIVKAISGMTFEEADAAPEWIEEGADAESDIAGASRKKDVVVSSIMATGPMVVDHDAERIARENEELRKQIEGRT